MTRTTPPRPVDLTTTFPELRDHTAMATRLHPRPGTPAVTDSSIGGPLWWPTGEPWPYCDDPHNYLHRLHSPTTVRRYRQILDAAWRRTAPGKRMALTDQERAELPDIQQSEPFELARQPVAMIPIMQVYRHDTPGFLGPPGSDLTQVLWCPIDHDWLDYSPRLLIKWRRQADIGDIPAAPPEPAVVCDDYLPDPCVLHPEQVTEFDTHGLPTELRDRIHAWEGQSGYDYFDELSIALGWKIGGFTRWVFTDSRPAACVCGAELSLLMTIGGVEWDERTARTWRPAEDEPSGPARRGLQSANAPTAVTIGHDLAVYCCPRSYDHPHHQTTSQ